MTITVTPTPRDVRGFTEIKYTTPGYYGCVVFNRSGEFKGASLHRDNGPIRVLWDDPEALPPGVFDAARAAYLEGL